MKRQVGIIHSWGADMCCHPLKLQMVRCSLAAYLRFAVLLLVILGEFGLVAWAQEKNTPPDAQESGSDIVIEYTEVVNTLTGAQSIRTVHVLKRDPTDPNRAFDPQTGRNYNWDPDKKAWTNSQTGNVVVFDGNVTSNANPDSDVVIEYTEVVNTLTGAQSIRTVHVLKRDPTDPNRAFDPQTGRNYNREPDKKAWVNSATGNVVVFDGYLTSTTPPSPAPTPTTPETPPKENKTVSSGTPPQPAPPKPLFSMGVGGGVGFNNIGGTSGDRAAFLNSFPGGTLSTSANRFAGNIGTSLGIGPMVFDFNAWRANGSDSNGSGPVLGGGTDTAHITQQFGGITLTGGVKIPLGGRFSLIPRGGGSFWHDNIDTKETVSGGATSSTATNSRGVDGRGWTVGAALQVDISRRWSGVARWDYLPMRNAGVNVHLNQFSAGVMFRLFGVPK